MIELKWKEQWPSTCESSWTLTCQMRCVHHYTWVAMVGSTS